MCIPGLSPLVPQSCLQQMGLCSLLCCVLYIGGGGISERYDHISTCCLAALISTCHRDIIGLLHHEWWVALGLFWTSIQLLCSLYFSMKFFIYFPLLPEHRILTTSVGATAGLEILAVNWVPMPLIREWVRSSQFCVSFRRNDAQEFQDPRWNMKLPFGKCDPCKTCTSVFLNICGTGQSKYLEPAHHFCCCYWRLRAWLCHIICLTLVKPVSFATWGWPR